MTTRINRRSDQFAIAVLTLAILALVVPPRPLLAAHAEDCPGSPPSGSMTTTRIIDALEYTTGRNVKVELSGSATDTDQHWNGSSYVTQSDTFSNADAYKWVITNLTTSSPLNLTGQSVNFTTKGTLATGGSLGMKIKDDGIHYQDYSSHWQVHTLPGVRIVDPTDIRIDNEAITHPSAWTWNTAVTWQLTYTDSTGTYDLPWSGTIQEQITSPLDLYLNVSPATPQTVTGTFTNLTSWTPGSEDDGQFDDPHWSSFPGSPTAGHYHVYANKQRFKNNAAGGALFGSTFTDYEYINSTPAFTHDEE